MIEKQLSLQKILLTLFIIYSHILPQSPVVYKSETLEIEKLTEKVFIHKSFYSSEQWGKVPCNGLIFINGNEVAVFDTPVDDTTSSELLNWIEDKKDAKVKAIIVNHFHSDCLGGLNVFHNKNIESYSSKLTIELAKGDSINNPVIPKKGFEDELILSIGNEKIFNKYFGEGHTKDNIVSFIPSEKILFGGCLIKATGAGKGNLEDANVNEWSQTVIQVKNYFPDIKFVVPGHGNYGDTSLLDYTINLFKEDNQK